MKYKPCCNKRCMVHGCKTKEQGACYCICRIHDHISSLQSIIEGRTLYDGIGFLYIPDAQYIEKIFNSWTKEKQDTSKEFKDIEAPKLIQKYQEKLKEFEINE